MMFEVSVEESATGRAYTIRSDKTTMFVCIMPSFVSTCVDNAFGAVFSCGGTYGRADATTCPRSFAFGAKTPWNRMLNHGGGTMAHIRASSSYGSSDTNLVPSPKPFSIRSVTHPHPPSPSAAPSLSVGPDVLEGSWVSWNG